MENDHKENESDHEFSMMRVIVDLLKNEDIGVTKRVLEYAAAKLHDEWNKKATDAVMSGMFKTKEEKHPTQ